MFSMIEVEINHACNRKCSYCPIAYSARKEQGTMEPALFNLLLRQLQDIDFSGRISYHFYNEPLMCVHLHEFVALTRKTLPEVRIVIYTNGDLLTEEKFEQLKSLGVNRFIVTQHEQKRRHDFSLRYDKFSSQAKQYIEFLNHRDLVFSNRGGLLSHIDKGDIKATPCFVPTSLVVVTLLGNVLPCFEDYNQLHSMGNIQEQHIRDIWNSKKFITFRNDLKLGKRHKQTICQKCNNVSVQEAKQYDYVL